MMPVMMELLLPFTHENLLVDELVGIEDFNLMQNLIIPSDLNYNTYPYISLYTPICMV
jgi:hypothetical protein